MTNASRRAARRRRGVATALVAAAFLAGTLWGNDDNFPFGPFRMFATSNSLNGHVDSAEIWGITASGEELPLEWRWIGLRRAEVEGQTDRFVEDPELLRHMARAYDRLHPEGEDLVAIELRQSSQDLVGGRPVGDPEVVLLARWDAR